jgi:CO/xanthine dehydrogenase FAD-binding subunit
MSMATKNIFSPDSLEAALDLIDKYGSDLLVIAGGTMAMHLINEGLISPPVALTLHRAQLNEVRAVNGHVEIGATTTLTRVAQMSDLPLLAEAARHIGGWAIRNMATLAGNLFVPPPAGDAAVALLALDAEVITAKKGSVRKIPLERFFTGLMETALAPGELVTRINVPRPRGQTAFLKFGRRQANTPAVVTVAAQVMRDAAGICTEARIALGAAGDYPLRAKQAEAALVGRALDAQTIADAAAAAMQEVQPFGDAIASGWYRRKMVGVYVRRTLEMIGG